VGYISIPIGNWGANSFEAIWYAAILETTPPYNIISYDTANWRYISMGSTGKTIPADISN